ncbi:hypothetical protein KFL_007760020 [Klebsormidium nitens]|uniref:Reverse transcriptase domain-containing protein n=1 Tax=Klebsormidium nitens TaxID=105231 RepID=A0A1Y1IL43_KLENI|nr:hypothetical protein KFL_007760020 [Klebsormidium nitens]|eukprot:GAQ91383.1 hypothetical protein KFL_007760020 [Klebsormidium nitens]
MKFQKWKFKPPLIPYPPPLLFFLSFPFRSVLVPRSVSLRFNSAWDCLTVCPSIRATEESLHKLADLTEAAEFEDFRDPAKNAAAKQSAPKHEPFLRHRLRRHVEFWQSFVTSSFVMGILLTGYMLPWISAPPTEPHRFPNHPSAFEHASFVTDAVSNLLATGTIQSVSDPPFLVSPQGVVPKAEDKLRLTLDLRFLNQFLQITKFKYESIRMISELCLPKNLLFTIDLKAGYHHIDIFEPHWKL